MFVRFTPKKRKSNLRTPAYLTHPGRGPWALAGLGETAAEDTGVDRSGLGDPESGTFPRKVCR